MSSQTEHTTAPAATGQGSHHYVLTLDIPGRLSGCWLGTVTPSPTATRHDVLSDLLGQIRADKPEFARANIAFFSLESNRL
ncbi:hypothetical protein ACFU51_23665 [Streptomyces sp. NPDC057430]|uniref:hypothetical protein n=1 Tax=Streptomyces sp. NPDC057430 TaxID=3346131 RepID=UPI0036938852